MTADLAGFLTAQLDEIEQAARAFAPSTGSHWHVDVKDGADVLLPDGVAVMDDPTTAIAFVRGDAAATHIALHDPAFVLAWVAALREVIRIYPRELGRIRPEYRSWVFLPSDSPDRIEQWSRDQEHDELLQLVRTWRMEDYLREVCFTPESPTILALARPFRGRPGWRDEWDRGLN